MLTEPGDRGLASKSGANAVLAFLLSCAGAGCATDGAARAPSTPPPPPTTTTEQVQSPPAPEHPAAPEPAPAPPKAWTPSDTAHAAAASAADLLHGSLAVRFRGRTDGHEHDADLGAVLALDYADPATARVSGHLQASADVDLDGKNVDGVFGSLDDTYDGALVAKLYLAYADIAIGDDPASASGVLRVGRQSDALLPEVLRIDGLSYTTRPSGKNDIIVGGYVGVPVHLYESSNDGDRAFGAFVEGRPWEGGRARLDWMHIEDQDVLPDDKNDLFALGLWQDLSDRWRFEGQYSQLEGTPRDLRLNLLYGNVQTETSVRIGYYELLEPQRALAPELDPFFEQLLEYEPFRQANVIVSQPLGEHIVLDVGIDARRVSDSSDVGEFNRNWERFFVTATFHDFATKGLSLSVTGDRWNDHDRDTSTLGADLSYDPQQHWTAALGTYYSLYKYEFLELDEHQDVRTVYLRGDYELSKLARIEGVYEFENDDFDTYHTLRLGVRWRF
jgi:hypothetical protein